MNLVPTRFRLTLQLLGLALAFWTLARAAAAPTVLFETTSAYHHIRVLEENGVRLLCFDDALQTAMSVRNPLQGHFEYTEYFHMPWLWNTNISSVLMIGLGGGSAQRSFEADYPNVKIESVEIDPAVLSVARHYFHFKESERQKVHLEDGRVFLRRTAARYDLVVVDAYVQGRYGWSIPQHLATREFFELVRDHLSINGIVAYNVIGELNDWQAPIVGAIFRTLQTVFPRVYVFPAASSENVVLLATRASVQAQLSTLRPQALALMQTRRITLRAFLTRLERLQTAPPASASRSPVLTDDYAPVEGLSGSVLQQPELSCLRTMLTIPTNIF